MDAVHQEYRGRDEKPVFVKEFMKKDMRNDRVQINRMTPAVVAFKDGETEEDFGQITAIRKGAYSPLITVRYDNGAQWPHIHFKIFGPDMANRKSPRVVEAFVYTDSLKYPLYTTEYDSISSLTMKFGKESRMRIFYNPASIKRTMECLRCTALANYGSHELISTPPGLQDPRKRVALVSPVSNSPFSLRKTPS